MNHASPTGPTGRFLLAGLLLALVSGCALAPEFFWQRVDDAVIDRADEWLSLEAEQERRLRGRLEPWLREVRRERLAEYADFLEGLAARLGPELRPADVRWANDRFESLYARTMDSFLPVIAPTLAELSTEQRRHLARRMQERSSEYRTEYVDSRDDGMYALAERVIRAVERWTGDLQPNQRALVHERIRELPRTTDAWARWRERMQQRLLALLGRGAGVGEIERFLHQWWVGRAGQAPAVRMDELRAGLLDTLLAVGRSLNSEQRREAQRKLRDRAASLRTLVASAE
ncbi:MAG: DUF6279 family lipoprotein [Halofilum sp. (in: g-proteobacteria)]|nr:DUF6279 family lipoprotein [Halofilum sp. (in: g-proteobacteria)]